MSKMILKTIGVSCICAMMALSAAAGAYAATEAPELPDTTVTDLVGETSPVLPVETQISELRIGDVNKNGRLDVSDATSVQLYCAYQLELDKEQLVVGDVNKDGIVDITDASLIQLMVAAEG